MDKLTKKDLVIYNMAMEISGGHTVYKSDWESMMAFHLVHERISEVGENFSIEDGLLVKEAAKKFAKQMEEVIEQAEEEDGDV